MLVTFVLLVLYLDKKNAASIFDLHHVNVDLQAPLGPSPRKAIADWSRESARREQLNTCGTVSSCLATPVGIQDGHDWPANMSSEV